MADLANIVRSSYNSHFYQSKRIRKMTFQRICYKNWWVAFHLVFQFTANLFGSRKSAKSHSHRLLVFAPTAFLFWSCNLVRIIYTWLTKSVFTAYIGLSLLVSDINYFLPSKIFVTEYTAKIKIPSAQKPGTYWNQSLRFSFFFFFFFFAAQDVCSKLQNQAKCDSAAFTTIPLKFNFSYTFWLLQVDIIARTNCHW